MDRCIFRSDCGDHSSCHLFAINYNAGRTREVPAASEVFLAGRSGRPAFRAALSKILPRIDPANRVPRPEHRKTDPLDDYCKKKRHV